MNDHSNNIKYDFSNKIVLVTGGTGALGSSITNAFVESNATVISSYVHDKEPSTQTENKSDIQLIKADITREEEVSRLISTIMDKYGHIDILVNVVGGIIGAKNIVELDEKEWDLMMTMNLKSAFLISKYVTRHMVDSKYGKIIHISSKKGLHAEGSYSAYAASKSGLIRLVESLSEETKESNINVNCIMPIIIDTQANRKAMPNAEFNKWVKPKDLANVVLFLSSEEAKAITGAAIPTFGTL
jgi:NAD(P)-dependent dehydrogenase (short-subunit alcohol dehydrogenase family)